MAKYDDVLEELEELEREVEDAKRRYEKGEIELKEYYDIANRLNNQAVSLFEKENYSLALSKFKESLQNFQKAKKSCIDAGKKELAETIDKNIENINANISECNFLITKEKAEKLVEDGLSFSENAKSLFNSKRYQDALNKYTDALNTFKQAKETSKPLKILELSNKIEKNIKKTETNIENCYIAIDKDKLEGLFKEARQLFDYAMKNKNEREYFKAMEILRNVREKYEEAYDIAVKRNFTEDTNALNVFFSEINEEDGVIRNLFGESTPLVKGEKKLKELGEADEVKTPDKPIIETIKKETDIQIITHIWNPITENFVFGYPSEHKDCKHCRESIEKYGKGSYWLVFGVFNKTDKDITSARIKFDISSQLKIEFVWVKGADSPFLVEKEGRGTEPYTDKYEFDTEILIPKGSFKGIYIKFTHRDIDACFKEWLISNVNIGIKSGDSSFFNHNFNHKNIFNTEKEIRFKYDCTDKMRIKSEKDIKDYIQKGITLSPEQFKILLENVRMEAETKTKLEADLLYRLKDYCKEGDGRNACINAYMVVQHFRDKIKDKKLIQELIEQRKGIQYYIERDEDLPKSMKDRILDLCNGLIESWKLEGIKDNQTENKKVGGV